MKDKVMMMYDHIISSADVEPWAKEELKRMLGVYLVDGCSGCAFESTEEWNMPCSRCKRNSKDYWRREKLNYQEAKARYDAWKKQRDEIHVGDEVTFYIGTNDEMKAVALDQTGIEGEWSLFTENGCVEEHAEDFIRKTGRHFDEFEELLKKMKGEP